MKWRPEPDRFWEKVRFSPKPDGCWEWVGCLEQGYGRFMLGRSRRNIRAHRWSYERAYGPVPLGKEVCHVCDNPRCVRPSHLRAWPHEQNIQDMKEKGRADRTKKARGERNGNSGLTNEQVICIMARLLTKRETRSEIARSFNIRPQSVSRIWTGARWAHLFKEGAE